jgi:hypothetical protein
MTSSTSAVPNGCPLQHIPSDDLALLLKIPLQEVTAMRTTVLKQQADPAWIAATLDALPAATLALLSLVIDAGGLMMDDQLLRAARDQFGMSGDDCRVAAAPAIARLLVVPLSMRNHDLALGAVLPAASLIAPLVADLDVFELPAAGFVAADSPVRNARTFLAICVATRHLEVKLTLDGRPHRAAIKRLAKQVGLDEDTVDGMLRIGLDLGLLRMEGELVRPDVEALADAAVGRYPRCPAVAAVQARVSCGPVASAALFRALRRRLDLTHARFLGPDSLACLPGFAVGTVDGVAAAACRALEGAASGHVTPSFEVFLPPESRLLDVVHVGACCEWERLDRALVARITKSSIARAVASGASVDQILVQLAAAIRHPIPQNVEAAVRDWASAVIAATIATGHVIVVDPGVRTRVAAALVAHAARELAPGVFVVDGLAEVREITAALTRAGVHHRAVSPERAAVARAPLARASGPEPAGPAPGAARLRARVGAWRRGEPFEGVRDDFLDKHRIAEPSRPAAPAAVTPAANGPAAGMLERWALEHQVKLEDHASHHGIATILAMLSADEAAKILAGSRDLDQLVRALARLVVKRGWSKPSTTARSRRAQARRPRAPVSLLWQQEGLRERLEVAAKRSEMLAVQLAGGVRYLEITQLIRRGATWMVLGENLKTDAAVALRLDDIQAIAALPDGFGDDDDVTLSVLGSFEDDDDLGPFEDDDVGGDDVGGNAGEAPRRIWRPGPGQAPPAGHVPCPCGSGVRYRSCCRDVPSA